MIPALDTEALKLIQDTAVKAAGVNVKDRVCVRDSLPDRTKWLLIDKDGNATQHDVSQPPRLHKLLCVQEVVAFATHAKATVGLDSVPIVWIGADNIIVTLDDRRIFGDRSIYTFENTPEWDLVTSLAARSDGLDQKAFLKLLRVQLAESFADDHQRLQLILALRKVRAQQQSAIGQGSGSFDASLIAESAADWPEHVDLKLRVIEDPALTTVYLVRCVFDAEPMPPKFLLTPLAAHLVRAENSARELASEVIRQQLKDSGIPVFLGQPE